MSHRRSPLASSHLASFLAVLALIAPLAASACRDGDGTTSPRTPIRVALAPRFQAGIESARPISRVRIIAHPALVGDGYFVLPDTLGITDVRVDPDASEWRLSVGFPPPTDTTWVVATIELLHQPSTGAPEVEWSGQTDPIEVIPGEPGLVEGVSLGRGPLENLLVYDVQVRLSNFNSIEGDTIAATASAFTQSATPATVFWGSLDTAVATVTPQGSIRTHRDGTARITATAGFVAETVAVTVAQRPASITLAPDSLVLTANAPTGSFVATIRDARGATIAATASSSSSALTWTSANPTLVQSLGSGFFQTSGRVPGRTTITVTAVNAPTVKATAPVVVR